MLKLADIWLGLCDGDAGCPALLADQVITEVVIDSRVAHAGTLFVALPGEKTDGHFYLADALGRGAIAAIVEAKRLTDCGLPIADFHIVECPTAQLQNPQTASAAPKFIFCVPDSLAGLQKLAGYWRSRMPAAAIGITGSVGKTTTKEIVANVLEQRFVTLRSAGNLNNEIGLPLTLLKLTPEHQRMVLEMGMYAVGEIANLCQLARPRIGIVTNVGPTHLERLGSIERIAQAKSELVQALPSASEGGVAILNADDPLVRTMAERTAARVFTYGQAGDSDLRAAEISSEGLGGIRFQFQYGKEKLHVHLPMLGRHSVHTALRGAAAGLVEGLSWSEIITGLQNQRGQLRLIVASGLRESMLIDDTYNASPASMLAALNLLADLINDRHRAVVVLGDMLELGANEEQEHRLVGGRAAQIAHKLVTVGSRARWIAEEALAAGMRPADVHPTGTNDDAIGVLLGLIRSNDIVLIKGSRGLAMEAIVDALAGSSEAGG